MTNQPAGEQGESFSANLDRLFFEKLRVRWQNWKTRHTGQSYRTLTQAMRDDPDFAHSWMCNIAMPIYDEAKGKLTIQEANAIADKLMKHLFDVDKSVYQKYQ